MSIFANPGILQTWNPVYTPLAPMTLTAVTTYRAEYFFVGQFCFFAFSMTGTIGGVPTAQISVSLPVPVIVTAGISFYVPVATVINGALWVGRGNLNAQTGVLNMFRLDQTVYVAGVLTAGMEGFYQAF